MDKSEYVHTSIQSLQRESADDTPCRQPDDEPAGDREIIDDEGDVLLRSGVREFLVSSKVPFCKEAKIFRAGY